MIKIQLRLPQGRREAEIVSRSEIETSREQTTTPNTPAIPTFTVSVYVEYTSNSHFIIVYLHSIRE